MPVSPTIYDLANLQQITQGGGALIDYLNQQRAVEDERRQTSTRLSSALALQKAENAGGLERVREAGRITAEQGRLNRENALSLVSAQERARIAASRAAALSGLQARYPRKDDEGDEEYMERVGKIQAEAPNRLNKEILLNEATAQTRAQELEKSARQVMEDAQKRRFPKVEAAARELLVQHEHFADLKFKKGVPPSDIPKAIAGFRAAKEYAKADLLESMWQSALTAADTPEKVPYPPELGTKLEAIRDQIKSVSISAEYKAKRLNSRYIKLIDDPMFTGERYLESGADIPAPPGAGAGAWAVAPLGPPASAAPAFIADPAGRASFAAQYLGTGNVPGVTTPAAVTGAASPLLPEAGGSLNDLLGINAAAGERLMSPGFLQDLMPYLMPQGSAQRLNPLNRRAPGMTMPQAPVGAMPGRVPGGPWTNTVPTSVTGDAAPSGLPMVLGDRRAVTQGRAPDMRTAVIIRLFGQDAPALLEQAGALATSRGMSAQEQAATFDKALAGDPKAIDGVRRVLNYLRMERDNPIQDEPGGFPIDSTIRDEPMSPMITPENAPYLR